MAAFSFVSYDLVVCSVCVVVVGLLTLFLLMVCMLSLAVNEHRSNRINWSEWIDRGPPGVGHSCSGRSRPGHTLWQKDWTSVLPDSMTGTFGWSEVSVTSFFRKSNICDGNCLFFINMYRTPNGFSLAL